MFCPVSLCSSFSFLFPLIPQLVAADGCPSPSLVLLEVFYFLLKRSFFFLLLQSPVLIGGVEVACLLGFLKDTV